MITTSAGWKASPARAQQSGETTVVAPPPARKAGRRMAAASNLARQSIQTLFRLGAAPFLCGFLAHGLQGGNQKVLLCQVARYTTRLSVPGVTVRHFLYISSVETHIPSTFSEKKQQKLFIGNRSEIVRCHDHPCRLFCRWAPESVYNRPSQITVDVHCRKLFQRSIAGLLA